MEDGSWIIGRYFLEIAPYRNYVTGWLKISDKPIISISFVKFNTRSRTYDLFFSHFFSAR